MKPLRSLLYETLRENFAQSQRDTLCDRNPHPSIYMQLYAESWEQDSR
ncbi:hypothetical protein [Nostoc sp. DSM 114160]